VRVTAFGTVPRTMPSAAELRAIATAVVEAHEVSPTSAARLARRFVDQHKGEVVRAAHAGKFFAEFDYFQDLHATIPHILQFFREDFPGVETTVRRSKDGTHIVVFWGRG
jgi:hypothetical protein